MTTRPRPPAGMRQKAPEPKTTWALGHKKAAVLILIGAVAGLIFTLDLLASILVKFL